MLPISIIANINTLIITNIKTRYKKINPGIDFTNLLSSAFLEKTIGKIIQDMAATSVMFKSS